MRTVKAENLQAGDMFVSLFVMPEYPPGKPIFDVIYLPDFIVLMFEDGKTEEVMNEMLIIIEKDR